jgi:Alpha/beta hydrolase domain
MDIYILKPVNLRKGNHRLFMEVNNRGNKLFGSLNNSSGGNDPTTADDAGEAFLMKRGYTLVWSGWDPLAPEGNDRLTMTVPVATNAGETITGPSYEYINFDNATTETYALTYPAATLDQSQASLTVKQFLNDPPTPIPASGWEYVDERTIRLLPAGTTFQQSHIYEFTYTAKDPLVLGLGLAATRDFVSFLRHAETDDEGNPNPLANDVQHAFTFAVSQPGRYLNDFRTLGFNQDEEGRQVFDGMLNYIAGSSGVSINYRFGQTARTERNRQNHFYQEGIFPFAFPVLSDPISGKEGGRNERCLASDTCPRAIEVNSANEYWVKATSLLHTDTEGNDLPDPENVRFFLISGARHGVGDPTSMGVCQQFDNPTDAYTALRALLVALDRWVSKGTPPPDSRVPRVVDGTAVFAVPQPDTVTGIVPQDELGFPDIPGVTYTGVITTRYLFDFGPEFDSEGIMSIFPPDFVGAPTYPSFVSRTDEDGNELAGIRLPTVAAPIATTTGWALRREGFGLNDGCESAGQYIPFATTEAERLANGDPRPSLEERYGTHGKYVRAVAEVARELMRDRLLLREDVRKYIQAARQSDVLK